MFSVIPEPVKFEIKSDNAVFVLSDMISVNFCDEAVNAQNDFYSFLKNVMNIECVGGFGNSVTLLIDKELKKEESYKITVSEESVVIKAFDEKGAFYAVQTLKQLLLEGNGELFEMEIFDYPKQKYRAFMLDTARYFFSLEAVKLFIDALALHKLNVFHLHLTDDQGWRIELYSKLLLAQIGGFRSYTNLGKTPHGGFYSKEDIEEIVSYASKKYITVVAEISQPSHTLAAISAYPFLSCDEKEVPVATASGIYEKGLCIGKESTFEFMKQVLDEVCELFPQKIIHIGGDFVFSNRIEACRYCKERAVKENLKNEEDLYIYYLSRIGRYLKNKGATVVIRTFAKTAQKLDSDFIFELTDYDEESVKLLYSKGVRLINSNENAYCLNKAYSHINLKDTYEKYLFKEEDSFFIGSQAFLYTDFVSDMKKGGKLTFPRLCAFSERVWSEKKDFEAFLQKLTNHYEILKTLPFDFTAQKNAMPTGIRKEFDNLRNKRKDYYLNKKRQL